MHLDEHQRDAGVPYRGLGIDFGTTNSALAACGEDRQPRLARFRSGAGDTEVFRSILFFEELDDARSSRVEITAGPEAIGRYVEAAGEGRLMQSLKTFLASRHAIRTQVFDASYELEELIGYLLRRLREQAQAQFGPLPGRIVVGRPVRFCYSHGPDDDARAESRLRRAFRLAGFGEVSFELEPVAAAKAYENALGRDEVVLVADFGGGTSDFSILRLGPGFREHGSAERVIGLAGVPAAGDALDARIVDHAIAPALGKGSRYRSEMGKWMSVPTWIYSHLSHWHDLASLRAPRNLALLHDLHRHAEEPQRLGALLHLIEHELGFAMTTTVQQAKARLSESAATGLCFKEGPILVDEVLSRADFEAWIGREVLAIERCVDELLEESRLQPGDIDRVFLTGGTSRVPRVARIFEERFPGRTAGGGELTSVASGLALCSVAPT